MSIRSAAVATVVLSLSLSIPASAQLSKLLAGSESKKEQASDRTKTADPKNVDKSGKSGAGQTAAAGERPSIDEVLLRGQNLLEYVALAMDQGVAASETIASMYPLDDDRVKRLRHLNQEFALAKAQAAKQKKMINSSMGDTVNLIGQELQNIGSEVKVEKGEQKKAIRTAYKRIGLMLLADAQAVLEIPDTLLVLTTSLDLLLQNPFDAARHGRAMKAQIADLKLAGQMLPAQVSSFRNVRSQVAQIAAANNITVKEPDKKLVANTGAMRGASERMLED